MFLPDDMESPSDFYYNRIYPPEMKIFCKNVLRIAFRRQLTASQFSEMCDLSPATVSRIRRFHVASINTIAKILKGLNVTMLEVLELEKSSRKGS